MSEKTQNKQKPSILKVLLVVVVVISVVVGTGYLGFDYYKRITITDIILPEYEIELELGEEYQLYPIVYPETAKDKTLKYLGYKFGTISVSPEGLITATNVSYKGLDRTTSLTIRSVNNKEAKMQITVKDTYAVEYSEETVKFDNIIIKPLVFKNKVENCIGFTYEYKIDEVIKGKNKYFENKEFVVYGRADNGKWIRLGTFTYGVINSTSIVDLTFPATDLTEVICVIKADLSPNKYLEWQHIMEISNVQKQK